MKGINNRTEIKSYPLREKKKRPFNLNEGDTQIET